MPVDSVHSPRSLNSVPRSAYVHVPFCVHRCGYCDFTVIANRDDLIGRYLHALELELRQTLQQPTELDTLFIGGGTPSYLPPEELERLFELLSTWFPVTPGAEVSVECNPDGFTRDHMQVLHAAGVNRISLGVQSFTPEHLLTLERQHSPGAVALVVEQLREVGFANISVDLIYAVPGQSLAEWRETLERAVDLRPEHVSTYGLTFEKGTSFWTRRLRGGITPADEELERDMYALAMEYLPPQGFEQYELSNFARSGFACRHNQVYWNQRPYFGIGPGAAALIDGVRIANHRSVTTWIQRLEQGDSPVQDREELDPELAAREAVMLGLRQVSGISPVRFRIRHGVEVRDLASEAYDHFVEAGWLEVVHGRLRLTVAGRFVADTVVAEFL
ncbi:MAG: radical SAM family heme chaperone HemW [Planctomycetaceae bacterium]|nr:radical SAM family heme chaperone HemW [Planctomycetaceae bacterium]